MSDYRKTTLKFADTDKREKIRSEGVPSPYHKESNFEKCKSILFNNTCQRIPIHCLSSFNLTMYQIMINR
jgi:hypothetical protein